MVYTYTYIYIHLYIHTYNYLHETAISENRAHEIVEEKAGGI